MEKDATYYQNDKNIKREAAKKLNEMGYDNFNRRIVNHNEFINGSLKVTYWASGVLRANKDNNLNYDKWKMPSDMFIEDLPIDKITPEEFVRTAIDKNIVEMSLLFLDDKQPICFYTECLSKRNIYAWDNNLNMCYLLDDYSKPDIEDWYCNITNYGINKKLWYPVNLITHSPWYNPSAEHQTNNQEKHIYLGIDQAPEITSIGRSILPSIDNIRHVSRVSPMELNENVKPYCDFLNKQYGYESYKFNIENKTGWMFIPIQASVSTFSIIVKTTDKRNNKAYYMFE